MNEKRAKHDERLKSALSLTDEQHDKMEAAGKSLEEKAGKLRNENTLSKENRRSEMKKLQADYEATVKTILSEDQFKKWEEMRSARLRKQKRK